MRDVSDDPRPPYIRVSSVARWRWFAGRRYRDVSDLAGAEKITGFWPQGVITAALPLANQGRVFVAVIVCEANAVGLDRQNDVVRLPTARVCRKAKQFVLLHQKIREHVSRSTKRMKMCMNQERKPNPLRDGVEACREPFRGETVFNCSPVLARRNAERHPEFCLTLCQRLPALSCLRLIGRS